MKLCFLADFRSSIARAWIAYFRDAHCVHVLSTHPAPPMDNVEVHPLTAGDREQRQQAKFRWASLIDRSSPAGRCAGAAYDRYWLPFTAIRLTEKARTLIRRLAPDLVHSLRIPIEAQIGAGAVAGTPHLISAWGNDFTLFAARSAFHRALTGAALRGCDAFLADAQADVIRARRHGLREDIETLVVPGAGGIDTGLFHAHDKPARWTGELAPLEALPAGTRLVVQARGFRSYVRNDSFFRASAAVLSQRPETFVVGAGLRGWKPVEELVAKLGIGRRVLLTGPLPQSDLAQLHRRSALMVSPTEHDGTPNTLLEAMACGALPVCGDLPSLREWIEDGVNGLLTSVQRPEPLRDAMMRGLDDRALAGRARRRNPGVIAARAEYGRSMERAAALYERVACRRSLAPVAAGQALPQAEIRSGFAAGDAERRGHAR